MGGKEKNPIFTLTHPLSFSDTTAQKIRCGNSLIIFHDIHHLLLIWALFVIFRWSSDWEIIGEDEVLHFWEDEVIFGYSDSMNLLLYEGLSENQMSPWFSQETSAGAFNHFMKLLMMMPFNLACLQAYIFLRKSPNWQFIGPSPLRLGDHFHDIPICQFNHPLSEIFYTFQKVFFPPKIPSTHPNKLLSIPTDCEIDGKLMEKYYFDIQEHGWNCRNFLIAISSKLFV